MSKLLEEIKYAFSNIDEGKAWPVGEIEGASEGWLIREKHGSMIAALPSKFSGAFDEQFASIHMRTSVRMIGSEDIKLVLIECSDYQNRDPFARVCEDFLSAQNGSRITENPRGWWERWKELMGNASTRKLPYAVIGELLLVLRLLRAGFAPEWTGPKGGSHDIELETLSFEVKSTIERVDETVTISSQYQLSASKEKELKLAFVRFEPGRGNMSINSLAEELAIEGFDANSLEDRLRKLGYPEGRTSREEVYGLLEAYIYCVDENFPRIIPESFKEESFPPGVIKLVYDISLSNLNRIPLDDFLNEKS